MELLNDYEKRILELLIEKDRTLSEISEELGLSKPATSKYLKRLEEEGVIEGSYERNREGRIVRYSLKPFHILLSVDPEERILVYLKANESLDVSYPFLGYIAQREFRREIKEYLSEVARAGFDKCMVVLYGSVAKGTAHRKSDIDLLFLKDSWSKREKERILGLLANSSNKCSHKVDPIFKTVKEFDDLDKSLKREINEYGIILYEKGKGWTQIKQKMRRYKTITI